MTDSTISVLSHEILTLSDRLHGLHEKIIDKVVAADRIACALYDSKTDLLKTFINSTQEGHAITAYEYKLADSRSLSRLAKTGICRVIDDIEESIQQGKQHSDWLREQKYQSSFTIPMFNGDVFLGFIFVDSFQKSAFTESVQRDLLLYSNLITMTISSEIFAVNSLLATASAARDFADLRDFETGQHLDRMALLSRMIAKALTDQFNLTDEYVEHVYLFAPLHDIGKIGIPDEILLKPGRLTPDERAIMETHVSKGVAILEKVLSEYDIGHLSDSQIMLNVVNCHHEFCDGSGYPGGLTRDQIPLEARIVTVADIFDALTSRRPYKEPWPPEKALQELQSMVAGGKLDVDCVNAIAENMAAATSIIRDYVDVEVAEPA